MSDSTWTTIDTKTDQTDLTTQGASYTYKCDTSMTVKQIRITVTKSSHEMYLVLSRVEFFGSMNLNNCPLPFQGKCIFIKSCIRKRTKSHIYFYILIIRS